MDPSKWKTSCVSGPELRLALQVSTFRDCDSVMLQSWQAISLIAGRTLVQMISSIRW